MLQKHRFDYPECCFINYYSNPIRMTRAIAIASEIRLMRTAFSTGQCPCDSWVAIIAYLLIAKIKADYKSPYSITEVATLIRISAFEQVDLRELITKPKNSIIQKQNVKELTLFDDFY